MCTPIFLVYSSINLCYSLWKLKICFLHATEFDNENGFLIKGGKWKTFRKNRIFLVVVRLSDGNFISECFLTLRSLSCKLGFGCFQRNDYPGLS